MNDKTLAFNPNFTYLGSVISADTKLDKDIDNRLAKAYKSFGSLSSRVWRNKHLRKTTKLKVYKAVIIPTLLYGAESWVTYGRHIKSLERFHQRCLRTITKTHWHDYRSDIDVLKSTNSSSIQTLLLKTQLRWAEHIARMTDHRLPKSILFGKLASGIRNIGAPKKRFKDVLKSHRSFTAIDHRSWATLAQDRQKWRHIRHKAKKTAEQKRTEQALAKRQKRKDRSNKTTNT